jgi:hypothetical protein
VGGLSTEPKRRSKVTRFARKGISVVLPRLPSSPWDTVSLLFTLVGALGFLIGSLLMLPETSFHRKADLFICSPTSCASGEAFVVQQPSEAVWDYRTEVDIIMYHSGRWMPV